MTVGFIGFGEACSSIALGLHREGMERIVFYDAMQNDLRQHFAEKAAACGGEQLPTASDVARQAEVVISVTPSNFAVSAAEGTLEGIQAGTLFLDASTATPIEKKKIAAMVEARGALFTDGAMMGALLKDRHQVPMLLSGKGAAALKEKMSPYHTRMDIVGNEPGTATSIKFIRSITAKGLSCLLIESLQTAQRFGVEKMIVDSLLDTFGPDFIKIIDGYISGAIIHSVRREHEMANVVDFLKSEGLPYTMAEATRQKLHWVQAQGIKEHFENGVPRDWGKVLEGWAL